MVDLVVANNVMKVINRAAKWLIGKLEPSAIQGNASICPSDPMMIIYFSDNR